MNATSKLARSVVVTGTLLLAGCSESVIAPVPAPPTALIAGLVTNVYRPTLDTLAARCARLATALQSLASAPSATTLQAAQAAWRSARDPYERNEAFGFGPLETGGYDPAMDTWPVDRTGIDALIAGSGTLSVATIDALDGTLKGFHGIEYVLFGATGAATAGSLSPRALAFLAAAGQSLANAGAGVAFAWAPGGGDYGGQLTNAGQTGSVYGSVGAALQEVIVGMVGPTDEIANSKIAQPLQTGDPEYEESRFSDNTLADLRSDVMGVRQVYLGGDTPTPGNGVSAFVAAQDASVDQLIKSQIADALASLDAVGTSFDVALHSAPAKLQAAQAAVLTLNQTLVNRVVPLVGALEE